MSGREVKGGWWVPAGESQDQGDWECFLGGREGCIGLVWWKTGEAKVAASLRKERMEPSDGAKGQGATTQEVTGSRASQQLNHLCEAMNGSQWGGERGSWKKWLTAQSLGGLEGSGKTSWIRGYRLFSDWGVPVTKGGGAVFCEVTSMKKPRD